MANSKISGLTAATTPLVGTEELVLVQTGNKRIAASNVSVGALKSNTTTGVMQITGPATGEIRVATVPNANFTVARTDAAQTFTGLQTFGSGAFSAGAKFFGLGWGVIPYTANSLVLDNNAGESRLFAVGADATTDGSFLFYTGQTDGDANERMRITTAGNVGIGTTGPGYKLTLSTDSAAKPSTSTWTVSSDERLKENIILADLDRCYEIVKSIPLKRYTWKDDVYTKEAVGDRSKLGWVAQDVKPLFNKAVNEHNQVLLTSTTTQEEYEEQDYTVEVVPKTTTEIKIINGIPTQIKTTVDEEVKTLLFNEVAVIDEEGNPILSENDEPLLHQVPMMVTKYRDKVVYDEIKDCLDLQVDQIYAAMYGAIQALQLKVEKLEVNKI